MLARVSGEKGGAGGPGRGEVKVENEKQCLKKGTREPKQL